MRRRFDAFWLNESPARAVVETLLGQMAVVALLLVVPLLLNHFANTLQFFRIGAIAMLFCGPVAAIWCAVRMRSLGDGWRQWLPRETLVGLALAIIPALLMTAEALLIVVRGRLPAQPLQVHIIQMPTTVFELLAFAGFVAEFGVARAGVALGRRWNQMRRQHLRWALTHAHLTVAAMGALLISLMLLVTMFIMTRRVSLALVPITVALTVISGVGLLLVLPPSALFSYLFARKTTQRLQELADATSALAAGDYAIRVPVAGEDEVARLQTNFNNMAADLEQAVNALQAERDTVAHLLEDRRELIASVSHELRTPVATLLSYLESTNAHWNGSPPETLRHDLEVMERETVQLQTLISDLFTLARNEIGRLELRTTPVAVGELVQRMVETSATLIWERDRVQLVAEVAPDLPPAQADAARLQQVVQNLLHNAVRHTPPGGFIVVAALAEAQHVVVQVRDTGEGILPEDLPHIWERFYRGTGARTQPETGTGLGLALVKELSEAMGGSVSAQSVPGTGSVFTVRFPRSLTGVSA